MNVLSEFFNQYFALLLPWLILSGLVFFMSKSVIWAKQRKSAVIAAGILIQMILPDPMVEHTIQLVVEQKEQKDEAEDESGEPVDDEKRNNA